MKIQLIDDHGIVLEEIEEIEQYHLGHCLARIELWEQIRNAIQAAQAVETDRELAQGDLL
jgi:hypothetical protein